MFFRLATFDLAVGLPCFFCAGLIGGTFAAATPSAQTHAVAIAVAVALLVGLPIYLVVAPVAYRRYRARPMRFPRCPGCNANSGPWGASSAKAPMRAERMTCGQCGVAVTFVYGGSMEDAQVHPRPAYLLQWPRPLGVWKAVR